MSSSFSYFSGLTRGELLDDLQALDQIREVVGLGSLHLGNAAWASSPP